MGRSNQHTALLEVSAGRACETLWPIPPCFSTTGSCSTSRSSWLCNAQEWPFNSEQSSVAIQSQSISSIVAEAILLLPSFHLDTRKIAECLPKTNQSHTVHSANKSTGEGLLFFGIGETTINKVGIINTTILQYDCCSRPGKWSSSTLCLMRLVALSPQAAA